MNKPKTERVKRIAENATFIGNVGGVPFYKHPTLGGDCPLLYITKDGRIKVSDFYELPSFDDLPVNAIYEGCN